MLASAYIEVDVLPVIISLLAYEAVVVVRIHITQIVCRRSGEARHGVEFEREHGLVVYQSLFYYLLLLYVPCPHLGASQWRFACLGRLVCLYFGQFERQTRLGNQLRHSVLIVYGERFAPITLA